MTMKKYQIECQDTYNMNEKEFVMNYHEMFKVICFNKERS